MTFQLERKSIEKYLVTAWNNATPIGLDEHEFEPIANCLRLSIVNGTTMQGSIGRTDNRIEHLGNVFINIYTTGGDGSSSWRGYAETLMGLFFNKRLDNAGNIASSNEFIRFSPINQHPYISGTISDIPFNIATLTAPFVRYSYQ